MEDRAFCQHLILCLKNGSTLSTGYRELSFHHLALACYVSSTIRNAVNVSCDWASPAYWLVENQFLQILSQKFLGTVSKFTEFEWNECNGNIVRLKCLPNTVAFLNTCNGGSHNQSEILKFLRRKTIWFKSMNCHYNMDKLHPILMVP